MWKLKTSHLRESTNLPNDFMELWYILASFQECYGDIHNIANLVSNIDSQISYDNLGEFKSTEFSEQSDNSDSGFN